MRELSRVWSYATGRGSCVVSSYLWTEWPIAKKIRCRTWRRKSPCWTRFGCSWNPTRSSTATPLGSVSNIAGSWRHSKLEWHWMFWASGWGCNWPSDAVPSDGVSLSSWAQCDNSVLTSDDSLLSSGEVISSALFECATSDEDGSPSVPPPTTARALEP